jgi:hypothetical protein
MHAELYSLSDVADLLRVPPHRILYLLSSRAVPEPRLRVAGKRLWTHEEIAVVSEKLKIQLATDMDRGRGPND